jgi:hypothetical protein
MPRTRDRFPRGRTRSRHAPSVDPDLLQPGDPLVPKEQDPHSKEPEGDHRGTADRREPRGPRRLADGGLDRPGDQGEDSGEGGEAAEPPRIDAAQRHGESEQNERHGGEREVERAREREVDDARVEVDRFLEGLGCASLRTAPAATSSPCRSPPSAGSDGPTQTPGSSRGTRRPRIAWPPSRWPRTTPPGSTRTETIERVVIGTVVFDAVFYALRRLGHERRSAARFGLGSVER